jgi:cation transport ATPase
MNLTDWIGAIGVSILLLAYFLNLSNRISHNDLSYMTLNVVGAGLALLASILLNYWPFIILETAWTIISFYSIIKYFNKSS